MDSSALWNETRSPGDLYSDHWISVNGVERGEDGEITGFRIADSGGGVDYIERDQFELACFGSEENGLVIDPTCIVVSKKES